MDTKIFQKLTYGMYAITTNYNGKNVGCIVNTITQITSQNPIISVSINKENFTNLAVKKSKKFAVNVLSENTDNAVISKFGFYSSKDIDKFENIKYEKLDNLPIIKDNTCGYMICEVIQVIECETHDVFFARVVDTKSYDRYVPMTYSYYHEVIKGKAPKKAPTYIEDEKIVEVTIKDIEKSVYICSVCGYVYDNSKEKVRFEDLPDNWTCPVCGVGKDKFKKI